jgi:putative endonuclease
MYTIYILLSLKDKNLYVGCTTGIEKRLSRHNSGAVTSTKERRPLVLLYAKVYPSKEEAFQRERFLKTLWSSRFKSKLKKQYFENL